MRITRNGTKLLVQAPAKINLSLKVLGKREDGFHDLETLMLSLRLYDLLTIAPNDSGKISLTLDVPKESQERIPTDERNLIVRAANLLREEADCSIGADIHLTKRIPSEAGLGGGSSDAAAALVSLNQVWNLNCSTEKLHEFAAQLGSDVNFFIDSNVAAVCTGRGEQVEPFHVSGPLYFVLVKPECGLSTAKVFQHLNLELANQSGIDMEISPFDLNRQWSLSRNIINALEQAARELNPEVDYTLKLLGRQDILASGMSGSGTACFGICRSRRHAQIIASRMRSQGNIQVWALSSGV